MAPPHIPRHPHHHPHHHHHQQQQQQHRSHHHPHQQQQQPHHQEEEYTDYSCSTAVERLSRDVETILRTWHVDRGSDHHVSSVGTGGGSQHRRTSTSTSMDAATAAPPHVPPGNIRLIRSNVLAWNVTVTDPKQGRSSLTIDLELALWDAPEMENNFAGGGGRRDAVPFASMSSRHLQRLSSNSSTSETASVTDGEEDLSSGSFHKASHGNNSNDCTSNSPLVRSLRRKPFGPMPSHDFLFDNFSTLFGIGQHISLTPVQPDPIPDALIGSIGRSILQRHDATTTARWVLAATLSQWLQTALNVAAANCHTCIPTFGVWGQYRPNHLVVTEPTQTVPLHQSHLHDRANAAGGGKTGIGSVGQNNKNGQNGNRQRLATSESGTGSDNGGNKASSSIASLGGRSPSMRSIGSLSGGDMLVGKTIQAAKEQQGQSMSTAASSSNLNHKRHGVQLFPHWAQACKKVPLPLDVLFYGTNQNGNAERMKNRQFSPPFVVGAVLTPGRGRVGSSGSGNASGRTTDRNHAVPHMYRKGANMWVSTYSATNLSAQEGQQGGNGNSSVMPSAAALLAGSARLSVWAGVLLQHCPGESVVVLTGGRHVFGWFKERNQDGPSSRSIGAASFLLGALGAAASAATTSVSSTSSSRQSQSGYSSWSDRDTVRRRRRSVDSWRLGAEEDDDEDYHPSSHGSTGGGGPLGSDWNEDVALYKRHCQEVVYDILEEAWGCKDRRLPMWGSLDDPVASVYATTTWNGQQSSGSTGDNNRDVTSSTTNSHNDNEDVVEPLLTFPLRIRSRRGLSKRDYADMEDSVERTILDPTNPSRFCVQAYYDRDTNVSTLAANQRCVLAAMVRAATLPNETLLHHLTDVDLVSLWDDEAGRQVANKLAERAHLGSGTRQIVDAMDWSTAVEELISVREAEYIVHAVMNGSLTADFPSSPEDAFTENDILSPFRKSAPWGRLLSVLFAHMARLRALSSVALVWRVFCQELRRRWDCRESLPNMQYIPGLDPHPFELYEQRCFSTIGQKANFAAFLNCTEPDPDDYHCLIGQKLQVFNLGVECLVAGELLENEAMEQFLGAGKLPSSLKVDVTDDDDEMLTESRDMPSLATTVLETPDNFSIDDANVTGKKKWPKAKLKESDKESVGEEANYGPPTIDRDLDFWVMDEPGYTPVPDECVQLKADPTIDDTGFDYVAPPTNIGEADDDSTGVDVLPRKSKKHKKITSKGNKKKNVVVEGLPDQSWEGTIMDGSEGSVGSTGTFSQAYFDAAEAGSIFSTKNGFISMDTVVNVADMQRRPGARCPVKGLVVRSTGDQLYAPYLQRPVPLTDDVVLERKVMLAKSGEGVEKRGALQSRIEVAHRLQKPKLLSDMRAFKAANPKCTIDDFTKWYGNPGSPLDDYNDDPINDEMSVQDAYHESAAKKLDKASEAMRVLVSTRDFWGKTWEEATPIPAAEQDPLFDYSTTVEMVLDYLEQLHPANLMNQVMAVNLSSAYFTLASSAKGTMKVGIVQLSLKRLRQKTEKALMLLSRDSTGMLSQWAGGGGSTAGSTMSSQFTSLEAICACEEACNVLSVTETMIARATSLLHKFPCQYKLVSDLLRFADGSTIALTDREGRTKFLDAVYEQQQNRNMVVGDPSKDRLPNPILREYVFRNLDDETPCQLAVRFGIEGSNVERRGEDGGVLLALMKAYGNDD